MLKYAKKVVCCLVVASMLAGCNGKEKPTETLETGMVTEVPTATPPVKVGDVSGEATQEPEETATPAPENTVYSILSETELQEIKPYEVGQVMILMYHGIVEADAPTDYQRTVADFEKDLQALYNRGFRLSSLKDLMNNNVTVEAGYTPVVITFDDGISSSFSLVEENGVFKPLPNSGFDIMMKFAEKHPDFGMAATFYINGNNDPFAGAGTLTERIQYLLDHGCDVGNHTYSHENLSELDGAEIQKQFGLVNKMIVEAMPDYEAVGVSYPFGIRPMGDEWKALALNGEYEGIPYHYTFGLREGQSASANGKLASAAPNHTEFDPLNVPRARGSETEGENTDLWGMLRMYETAPERRYISDGNPDTIAVPEEYMGNLNKDSLGDKQLITYTLGE